MLVNKIVAEVVFPARSSNLYCSLCRAIRAFFTRVSKVIW